MSVGAKKGIVVLQVGVRECLHGDVLLASNVQSLTERGVSRDREHRKKATLFEEVDARLLLQFAIP